LEAPAQRLGGHVRLPRPFASLRRRVKVEITCPHGVFIPGAYRPGPRTSRYSCDQCGFELRLSSFRGGIDW
jgi:hypothetical protein